MLCNTAKNYMTKENSNQFCNVKRYYMIKEIQNNKVM